MLERTMADPIARQGIDAGDVHIMEPDKQESRRQAYGASAVLDGGHAVPFYCSEEMSAVIEQAAKVMDPSDQLDTTLIPSEEGFCYFAGGLHVTENMTVHALLWIKDPAMEGSWALYGFNDRLIEEDGSVEGWDFQAKEAGIRSRWIFRFHQHYVNGSVIMDDKQRKTSEELAELGHAGSIVPTQPVAFAHALFLMINQPPEIIELTKTEATEKKAARLKKDRLPTNITVVNLTQRYVSTGSKSTSGERTLEHSHRWVVNGFWRWQPYKLEKGGEWLRKRIWIAAHIKGPADKPLNITEKVYALIK